MIVSLFGPDGVGKSTIANRLQSKGAFVFSGTGVASWPDQTWIRELEGKGIDEPSYNDEGHFIDKIVRCHELARKLEKQHDLVVIDSDPLHKTLMHDALKGRRRHAELWAHAYPDGDDSVHVYLHLAGASHDAAATELQRRIHSRGELAPFDPESVEQSVKMIEACEQLSREISVSGGTVIDVATDTDLGNKQINTLYARLKQTAPLQRSFVAGGKVGASKLKKAESYGTKIITEKDLLELL